MGISYAVGTGDGGKFDGIIAVSIGVTARQLGLGGFGLRFKISKQVRTQLIDIAQFGQRG